MAGNQQSTSFLSALPYLAHTRVKCEQQTFYMMKGQGDSLKTQQLDVISILIVFL